MIKLRLKRFGKKREVSYRIVAMQSTSRRDGRPLEELGYYNPRTDETRLEVPAIVRRLQQGAQPTPTVRRILEKANVFEQLKTGVITTPQVVMTKAEPALSEPATTPEASEPATTDEAVEAAAVEPAEAAEAAAAEAETAEAEPVA
ncbi:MAG: 30S ribosomal protein S16 [Leptolyngbyaceae cyanobacterium]